MTEGNEKRRVRFFPADHMLQSRLRKTVKAYSDFRKELPSLPKAVLKEKENGWLVDFGEHNLISLGELSRHPMAPDAFEKVSLSVVSHLDQHHKLKQMLHILHPNHIFISADYSRCIFTDYCFANHIYLDVLSLEERQYLARLEGCAPEYQLESEYKIGVGSDLFAVAGLFLRLLLGESASAPNDIDSIRELNEKREDLPPELVSIIRCLLSLNPDDRYLSCHVLLKDLHRTFKSWKSEERSPLQLCSADAESLLRIPHHLIAREEEIQNACDFFQSEDRLNVLLNLEGMSGSGKTHFVKEICNDHLNHLNLNHTFLITCHDSSRHHPYFAIREMLYQVVQYLHTNPKVRKRFNTRLDKFHLRKTWKSLSIRISDYDLSQEYEHLVNVDLQKVSNRARFDYQQLLEALESLTDHFLFVFDNVHWMDAGSLNILQQYLRGLDQSKHRFILASRSESIKNLEIIRESVMQTGRIGILNLCLLPFSPQQIHQFLIETIGDNHIHLAELSQLMVRRTEGIPYLLINEILTLYFRNQIHFQDEWRIEIGEIRKANDESGENLPIWHEIPSIGNEIRSTLGLLSIIGNRFSGEIANLEYSIC